jgi:hypothetical protein
MLLCDIKHSIIDSKGHSMATKYVSPNSVISPRLHWSLITVLDDTGPGGSALAIGRWDTEPVLGMRWNGDNDSNPIGNPQSRGIPTWFILPAGKYTEAVLKTLPPDKLTLARNFIPQPPR